MRLSLVIGCIGLLAATTTSAKDDDLLTACLNDCVKADSWSSCLKREVLNHLDVKLGTSTEARSLESLDEALISRAFKFFKSFDYAMDLPVVDGKLRYRPSRSLMDLDVEFKEDEAAVKSQARGILKKKLLLPVLLLLKLKMKALMPIFVAIIGFKALKALVLSKLAIMLVVGFIAVELFKKKGMMPAMGMTMDPAPVYGAPPVVTPLTTTTSGYEPVNNWDGVGPYSRVWTPSNGADAQNLAYNYYSSGHSNSYGSPSSSSSSNVVGSSSSSSSGGPGASSSF